MQTYFQYRSAQATRLADWCNLRFTAAYNKSDSWGWRPAVEPKLQSSDLVQRVWQVVAPDKAPFGNYLRLFPNGKIGGTLGTAVFWEAVDGTVSFFDRKGCMVAVLDEITTKGQRFRLAGRFLTPAYGQGQKCQLREFRGYRQLARRPVKLDWFSPLAWKRRRNLVLIGANEKSFHYRWDHIIGDAARNWDLGVIFYGDTRQYPPPGPREFSIAIPKSSKFVALYQVLHEGSSLWNYERIWLPDDDLLISWANINLMFEISEEYDLLLAQPALTADSYFSHQITRQQPQNLLRFVSFVEGMAPVFTSDALRTCAPTFGGVKIGWGLDHIWPKLLGQPDKGLAIIDGVTMDHGRPVAGNYSSTRALREMDWLMARYGAAADISELSAIALKAE